MGESYEETLRSVLWNGEKCRSDRTGTGTISKFGCRISYNLQDGFPLITSKKVHWKSVIAELLWFLRGDSNISWLKEQGVSIWDEWANEDGDLGPIYGVQWRKWTVWKHKELGHGFIDQIAGVIKSIKRDPYSRRHIVSAWNPSELNEMALPPCHILYQFYVSQDKKLSIQVYQRSADMFLGVPFNLASYAALTHMIAQQCELELGDLIWVGGDCHIYENHIEQAKELLTRTYTPLPRLYIKRNAVNIDSYNIDDFEIVGYYPHPAIKAPVAV